MRLKITALILFVQVSSFALTKLSGNVESMVLESSNNPFVVVDDVIVPEGKKLEIGEGCVFLFKPFTGITVEGEMDVSGSGSKPVIFTSENDDKYNQESTQFPNPFDWNGILIKKKATQVKLSNFILKYSVYGLKSYKDDFLINNGIFSSNGQSNVSTQGVMKNIVDGIPFNYKKDGNDLFESEKKTGAVNVEVSSKKAVPFEPRRPGSWHQPVAIVTGATGLAALGVSCYFFYKKNGYARKYSQSVSQSEMNDLVTKQESSLRAASISAVGGILMCAGGVWLYILDRKNEKSKKISISPLRGNLNGMSFCFEF
jgi:hypothetical protein